MSSGYAWATNSDGKGLAKVSRKKTPKDDTFLQQMCDSIVVQYVKMKENQPRKGHFWKLPFEGSNLQLPTLAVLVSKVIHKVDRHVKIDIAKVSRKKTLEKKTSLQKLAKSQKGSF